MCLLFLLYLRFFFFFILCLSIVGIWDAIWSSFVLFLINPNLYSTFFLLKCIINLFFLQIQSFFLSAISILRNNLGVYNFLLPCIVHFLLRFVSPYLTSKATSFSLFLLYFLHSLDKVRDLVRIVMTCLRQRVTASPAINAAAEMEYRIAEYLEIHSNAG